MSDWIISGLDDCEKQYVSIAGESLEYFDDSVWQVYIQRIGRENFRCVWTADRQFVGGLAFYRMGQWYGGKVVRCAGVSGVGIDPAHRGTGACKTLLQATLRELHEERMPLAGLYASTRQLYRSVGFEISGHRITYGLQMHGLRASENARELLATRTREPNFEQLASLDADRGRYGNGMIERTDGLWQRIMQPIGRTTSTYILGDPDAPEGYATLVHGKREYGHPQPLLASDWIASTPRALERLIALVTDHRSMCNVFHWCGGPQDPLLLACKEEHLEIVDQLCTLNRIVHLETALESRGYPKGVRGELHLDVTDELMPENAGKWVVSVEDGRAIVERGGRGDLKTSIRDLVPLYSSMYSCRQLVSAGRVAISDDSAVQFADQIFAGPSPWTPEIY